jgi:hypothetical protein
MLFKEIIAVYSENYTKAINNSLKSKRERVRKDSIRVEEKRKDLEESERRFISEGEKRVSEAEARFNNI